MEKEYRIIAVLKAKHGQQEKLKKSLITLVDLTQMEPDCVYYNLFEATEDPGAFYVQESFKSERAFSDHMQTPHLKAFAAEAAALLSEPIKIIKLTWIA